MKSDQQLNREVMHAILWDARVSPASIEAATKDGVVSLRGVVDSYIKKWSARETVFGMPGVRDVIDTIVVKPAYKLTDESIQKNIQLVLENDIRLDGMDVEVSIQHGVVSLAGKVNSLYQRIAAEETCRWVRGVIDVKNNIKVESQTEVLDREIETQVKRQFKDSKELNRRDIEVSVDNRIVRLTGAVDDRRQCLQAEALASIISSVTFVQNEIEVRP